MVQIRFYGELYEITKIKEYNLKIAGEITLLDLIEILDRKLNISVSKVLLDDKGKIKSAYVILVNGSAVREDNPRSVRIRDEDILAFLPPAVGGKLYCSTLGC
ncbi:MAG: MoaD/ThiS family protein [Acidilobaceae archaeon]